jgi:hypothetical protein
MVYRSRARQAAGVGLIAGRMAYKPSGPTNCGLGREAAVELDLSPEARKLFDELWPEPPPAAELERIRGESAAWIERQDQLDRDRNHLLKAFRQRHGFDRSAYGPEQTAELEAGLAEVNGRCDRERAEAAARLLG